MIDCVLVYPRPSKESSAKRPALSIFCLGAMLEKFGLNVEYFDERFDSLSGFESLMKKNPICVGVSSMTGYQLIGAQKIFKTVKKINSEITTLFGGVHPSLLAEECISDETIDIAIVGEGEETLLELVNSLKKGGDLSKIKGIWWKNNGKIISNGKRDYMAPSDWPFPFTAKTKRYFKIASDAGEIMYQSTRGCPHDCRFCYNNVFSKLKWRKAPLDKIKNELAVLKRELNFNKMLLCDDNIGPNRKRLISLSNIFKELDIKWYSSIRANSVDVELLRILEKNGATHLLIGIESGSDRILKEVIHKGYGVKDIRECTRAFSQSNIQGRYNFIYGVPTDTIKDLHKSMDLVDWIMKTDKNAIIAFDAYSPYPGTELYDVAIKRGFNPPKGIIEWSKMSLSNPVNPTAEAIYYIAGLKTRGKKGDITSKNFPGIMRLLILAFEISAHIRWRLKLLSAYGFEKFLVKRLLEYATKSR